MSKWLEVAPVMGQPSAVAEPLLFLQPAAAGAQEPEANTSWASTGAFCAGAGIAAGLYALSAQPKSSVQEPTPRAPRAVLRAASRAAVEMTATMEAPTTVFSV